jgi:DNA-binding transcriptional MerR regulator
MTLDRFKLNQLEQLTGIKASTLRMWEIRYGIFKSKRSTGNVRYYTDEELKKILAVVTLVNKGFKISKVAKMNHSELSEKINEITSYNNISIEFESYINNLISSVIEFDAIKFNNIFSQLVKKYGFKISILKIIYPLLNKLGLLWTQNTIIPAHEHFATHIIRNKIIEATSLLPQPISKNPLFLLALPPNEYHELSLLLCNYILRLNKFPVIYLGQTVPYDNIIKVCKQKQAAFILLIYFLTSKFQEVELNIRSILKECKKTKVIIGGNRIFLEKFNFFHKRIKVLYTINQFIEFIEKYEVPHIT